MVNAGNASRVAQGPCASQLWRGVFAAFALLFSIAIVQAQTAPVGGPGGVAFSDNPPSGVRLAAVALRAGELIDAVAAVVVRSDGQRVPLQLHGGPGGTARVFALEDGEYLVAMRVWSGQVVEAIQFETNRRVSPLYGRPRGAPQRLIVPPGSEAVGFIGRSGLYVDALGLALQPRASQPPAPQSPSVGSNVPRPGSTPAAPPPSPTVSRVELDGPIRDASRPTTISFALQVRFKQPTFLKINLSADPPRNGKCFGPQERVLKSHVSSTAEKSHVVKFSGLRYDTRYHYSIVLDAGRCELGTAATAVCIDLPC